MNQELLNKGLVLGEISSSFDWGEDADEVCSSCGFTLEWNGFCSECGDEQ